MRSSRSPKKTGYISLPIKDDILPRIQELLWQKLPEGGQIILSGRKGTVIIYDAATHSYREAAFDTSEGQPIPTKKPFEIDGHQPLGSLETVFFSRSSGEAQHL